MHFIGLFHGVTNVQLAGGDMPAFLVHYFGCIWWALIGGFLFGFESLKGFAPSYNLLGKFMSMLCFGLEANSPTTVFRDLSRTFFVKERCRNKSPCLPRRRKCYIKYLLRVAVYSSISTKYRTFKYISLDRLFRQKKTEAMTFRSTTNFNNDTTNLFVIAIWKSHVMQYIEPNRVLVILPAVNCWFHPSQFFSL